MKKKMIFAASAVIMAVVFCRCTGSTVDTDGTVIPFREMQERTYSDIAGKIAGSIRYIVYNATSEEQLFSEPDKVIFRNGMLYIHDWQNRRIIAVGENGNFLFSLDKRGRGPGEYLQITDFDVDGSGGIWVIDGQKDRLLHYDSGMACIGTRELPFEANYIRCLGNGNFLVGLASWDTSRYGGRKVLVTDMDLNVSAELMEYDEFTDPNYAFPSAGFVGKGDNVLYHQPIDDSVYEITPEGKIAEIYRYDFGARTVPDEMRADIERHRDEFDRYRTLVKSQYIDDRIIAGSILEGRKINDFIIDRERGTIYLQDDLFRSISVIGISDGHIILRISDNDDSFENLLPEDIRNSLENGNDVFGILDVCDISNHFFE